MRKLYGQDLMGPSGVLDQSLALINLAISSPSTNQSSGREFFTSPSSGCVGVASGSVLLLVPMTVAE